MDHDEIPDDYYDRLGIDKDVSLEAIKSAFRKKAKKLHSDQGGDDKHFIALKEAYDTLSNPEARASYDAGERGETRGGSSATGKSIVSPYLTPDKIAWVVVDSKVPDPVTVRLSNYGGFDEIREFGSYRQSGAFWTIEDTGIVMAGDDLAEYVFAPVSDTATVGEHTDEARFFIDDQVVSLPIVLSVTSTETPKTPSTANPRSSTSPRPPTGSFSAMSPVEDSLPRYLDSLEVSEAVLMLVGVVAFVVTPFLIMGPLGVEKELNKGGNAFVDLVAIVCGLWGIASLLVAGAALVLLVVAVIGALAVLTRR
jgi:hypothetical protein